ncbi:MULTISPECIES: IS4 family transposase, partial [unclassified Microcystis]
EAVRMIASLGGFLGRKGDGEPGVKTIWLGLRRLHDISETWKLSHQISPPIEPP